MLDESQSSLIYYLYKFLKRDFFPYGSKLKVQSIHTKHPVLPVYTNTCCDRSNSNSSGEILIGTKTCDNKTWQYILNSSSLSSLPEEILKS